MDLVLFIMGGLLLILAWIMLHDTTHFEKTEYCITDPRIKKGFRAVVLADLHNQRYGRDNALLLESIDEGKPDVVLIAGDMLTAKPGKDFDVALKVIEALAKKYPICYGVGNHEHRLTLFRNVYGSAGKEFEAALGELGVRLMKNERKEFPEYGVSVVGSRIHHRYYRRRMKKEMRETYLPRVLGQPDPKEFTILLAHNPDYFPEYAAWGADLVLSGHVHGGVVRIPFWGKGVVSPAVKFFPKYDGGLFEEGKAHMILSRGLGAHTIPFRLFNPGDLIFLQFEKGKEKKIEKRKTGRSQKAL